MAKFYMTEAFLTDDSGNVPIAINIDHVSIVQPVGDSYTGLTMSNKEFYLVHENYGDFVKKIKPFIPFDEMVNSEVDTKWMRNYLNKLPKGATLLANDNNG